MKNLTDDFSEVDSVVRTLNNQKYYKASDLGEKVASSTALLLLLSHLPVAQIRTINGGQPAWSGNEWNCSLETLKKEKPNLLKS